MAFQNPKAWARKNKKEFANKMITNSGVTSHNEPAGFFMAGLPGAGKTEFTENLIRDLNLKVVRIDMDEIATHIEGYGPDKAHSFREAATDILNAVFDRAKHRKVDFMMDGTFGSSNAIKNIELALKKNYVIKVFYVHQEPEIAWKFTRAREKIEKRSISMDGFIQSYYDIQNNIKKLATLDLNNVAIDIVMKDGNNKVGNWLENVTTSKIDDIFASSYNKDELQRILNT